MLVVMISSPVIVISLLIFSSSKHHHFQYHHVYHYHHRHLYHYHHRLSPSLIGDDDGGLSWEEFEAFFLAIGWGNGGAMVGGGATQSTVKTFR